MDVLAVILLFVTVLIGVVVLAEFADPRRMAAVRGAGVLVGGHVVLALGAAALWVAYLLARSGALAWAGVLVLAAVAALGLTVWRRSTVAETRRAPEGDGGAVVAARPMAPGLLIAHGAAAAVTLLLALLVAAGMGR